jgi:DNA-binding NarL/FixJ family response regulator
MNESLITIGLVDDHKLFRKGLAELLGNFTGYQIVVESNNGKEILQWLERNVPPQIMLVDINMPEMDGYETVVRLKQKHPDLPILALSMDDDERSILQMIKAGARGYVLKDADPAELRCAVRDIVEKGVYHSDLVSSVLLRNVRREVPFGSATLTDRESEFLKLACSEFTYKEIADKMCVAPRTIDGYRETLFEKLGVKSRVGLVLYAVRNGIFKA